MRVISRRIHSSNAARKSDPSSPIRSKLGIDLAQHAARDLRAHRPADQPAALLAHPLLDGGAQAAFFFRQHDLQAHEHEAEHLLVPPALHQLAQHLRHDLPGPRTAQQARHDARDRPARPPVLDA